MAPGRNSEGYPDPTAETAIRRVDRQKLPPRRPHPKAVVRMIGVLIELLDINNYNAVDIIIVDRRNGKTYRWKEGREC